VNRHAFAAFAPLLGLALSGCWDPFATAVPETPDASSSLAGASTAAQVPARFGQALESDSTALIPVLVSDAVQVVDGTTVQTYTKLYNCASTIAGISGLGWEAGSITRVSTTSDTVVEQFDYSIWRRSGSDSTRIAHATAQWTVARDVYWTLVLWQEDAGDSGWTSLCGSPR
jgi:hypothetical protein